MANAPRLYLFHGSDNRASLFAMQRWESVFLQKYGEASRYSVNADELTLDQVRKACLEIMQGMSLFSMPKLVLIKRLDAHEKGKPAGTAVKAMLEQLKTLSDSESTIVCWSDCLLAEKSAILEWFTEQQTLRVAKITVHAVPTAQEVGRVAQEYLKPLGKTLQRPALVWLIDQYKNQERAQRLALKLKANDQMPRDMRSWWLHQVVDMASLVEDGSEISLGTLQWCAEEITPISVFEIINAVRDNQWDRAHALLLDWETTQDSSDFFGLWSLLRMHFRKLHDIPPERETARKSLQLLAELEIISKNTQVAYPVLTSMLMVRLEEVARTGILHSTISGKRLWLSTLPLS